MCVQNKWLYKEIDMGSSLENLQANKLHFSIDYFTFWYQHWEDSSPKWPIMCRVGR